MAFSISAERESFAHDPRNRGYGLVYREDAVNRCPGCGRTQWYVGRFSAECGNCATALPLAAAHGAVFRSGRRGLLSEAA